MKRINLGPIGLLSQRIQMAAQQMIVVLKAIQDVKIYGLSKDQTITFFEWINNPKVCYLKLEITDEIFASIQAGTILELVGTFNDLPIKANKVSTEKSIFYDWNPESAEAYYGSLEEEKSK